MKLNIALSMLFYLIALAPTSVSMADSEFYPIPSPSPLRIGEEEFRERYMSLHRLEGVYVDFNALRSTGEDQGIIVPASLYVTVQEMIEKSGMRFLSEDEMLITPGQPTLHLWPSYQGVAQTDEDQEMVDSGSACVVPPRCENALWASFEQSTMLLRQPENQFKLATWGGGERIEQCTERAQWIAAAVIDQVERFIDDYVKAQRDLDPVRVSNVDDVPQYCSQAWVTHLNMFATNETRLNANMTPILDRLHAVAARCNTFSYIIETHADQRADAQYNKLLTEGRARSIKDYLLSLGMAHHRILMNPMGESAPIATGTSASDHAKNRRIVIKPIRQQDLASASLDLH